MEAYSATTFEDVRHDRSITLLLSLTDTVILKQSKFTDDKIKIMKNIALQKLHRQRNLKEYVASSLVEEQFSNL